VEYQLAIPAKDVENLAAVGAQQSSKHFIKIVKVSLGLRIENGKDFLD